MTNPYLSYPGAPIILDPLADPECLTRVDSGTRLRLPDGREATVPLAQHFDVVATVMADLAVALAGGTDTHAFVEDERRRWRSAIDRARPYGLWVYLPGPGHLLHFPPRPLWQLVQSISSATLYRDFGLCGTFESMREAIGRAVPAVAGCSVGWRIIEGMALYRVGWLKVSDRKPGHPRGNNRAPHSYLEMLRDGSKAHSVARRLHAIDALTPVSVYGDGITKDNVDDFVAGNARLGEPRATMVFDEIDHLPTKFLLRAACKRHRVTYAMITDIGRCSLVEIRDFDAKPELPLVHGLSDAETAALLSRLEQSPDAAVVHQAMMSLVGGPDNVAGEMNDIIHGRGEPPLISSMAQDGSTCLYGGVLAPRLLLAKLAGRTLPGRQLLDPMQGVLRQEDW